MFVINSTNEYVYEVNDHTVLCPFATVKVRVSHFFENKGRYRGFVDSCVVSYSVHLTERTILNSIDYTDNH